ncbi:MAG: DPP IV N-terminal domain-containing protein [Pseudoxanthomonas sp.]
MRSWAGRAGAVLMAAMAGGAMAQTVTTEDYARAARLLPQNAERLVDHLVKKPAWAGDRFLYTESTAAGARFMQLVPGAAPQPAFDHAVLAEHLGKAAGKELSADTVALKASAFERQDDGRWTLSFDGKRWRCDLSAQGACEAQAGSKEPGVRSPDGKHEAFVRDWNLWLRDADGGNEVQLTTDGVEDYGYATDNAGWKHTDRAILVWSPDSSRIATFQQDQRQTGQMTLVSTSLGHPKVETWKYPLVGDEHVTMIERVIVDVAARKVVRLQMSPDQHRSTLCDDVSCDGGWEDVQWAPDGRALAFASSSRDHKQVWLREADAATGQVRTVFWEKIGTWFESGLSAVSWRYLPTSRGVLWFSQRSNWGNLYLYDLDSGKLQYPVTRGDWNVGEVVRVDEPSRTVWFTGQGREPGRNPYYRGFYRTSLDAGEPVLLTPEDADHSVVMSGDGKWLLDTYSTVDTAPVTVLRDAHDGKVASEVARADLSRLQAAGWVPPQTITVKGRDGKTDLYGLMFKPSNFDPARKYPIVDYVYPGPQVGSVRSRSFLPAHGDNQALAELGFIVVAIDGMGTPGRSKAFHDTYYADIGDNTLPDQVAGLKELGKRYPFVDLGRVGIWGHSGGGNATVAAMFRYPDFFKVGIAESGNHDNRNYEDDWAEKWQGLLVKKPDGSSNYDDQANAALAGNLKGRLLLAHGLMDDNVPPYQTWLVVDALVKANKDFDLVVFPHARHGYAGADARYMTRKRWDYFVRNLLGATPPEAFELPKEP